MGKILPGSFFEKIRNKIGIIITAGVYFGLLAYTMYHHISTNGITKSIIQLAVVVTAFAVFAYIMFFSARNRFRKRHVIRNSELELEITKKKIIFDRIIAALFLIVGAVLMLLTL